MKMILLTLSLFVFSCGNSSTQNPSKEGTANAKPVEVPVQDNKARAYFASGCFWCVEAIYESVEGVEEVISGYSGGHTKNPTYESSNTGKTGHAEAVEVIYNPKKVDFTTLARVYFGSQNPTQVNGQGPDVGSQYRSIIFFQNEEQKKIIEDIKGEISKNYDKPIAAEVVPFQKFWRAEDYHQNYEELNPDNPYIQNVSIPRLEKFKKKFPEVLKKIPNKT
jgi:peptide-methionine (S)-S-oxide reductase